MKNIILIGMPSAGKSTVGVLLAKKLVMEFLDTDLVLQSESGKSLSEMIEETGEDAFLLCEERALLNVTCTGTVVATGGSAVYSDAGMTHLKENGIILYIKLDEGEVADRVGNLHSRGVVLHGQKTLDGLYRERTALYEKYADCTADVTGCTVGEALERLLAAVKPLL